MNPINSTLHSDFTCADAPTFNTRHRRSHVSNRQLAGRSDAANSTLPHGLAKSASAGKLDSHSPNIIDLSSKSSVQLPDCQSNIQTMSDILLAPDPFKGTSTEDASDFLDRFKHFADYKKLSAEKKASTFPLLLRGTATVWYSTLEDDVTKDFTAVEAKFKERYGIQTHKAWSHVTDIFRRKQKDNENVMD